MKWFIVVALFLYFSPTHEEWKKDITLDVVFKTEEACILALSQAPTMLVEDHEAELKKLSIDNQRAILRGDASCKSGE